MGKYYYISFDDLENISELDDIKNVKNMDVYFNYKYMRILAIEESTLDKVLARRCVESHRPYFIEIFHGSTRRSTIEYDFKKEDYKTTKRMFREMAQEKELYIFEKDYEYFKDSPVLYRVYKVKGKSYYKIVIEEGAHIPDLLFPYICNDMYYNIEDEEELEFLRDIHNQELEEL